MLEKAMLPKWAVFFLTPEVFLELKTPSEGISACLSLLMSPQSIPLAALTSNSIPNRVLFTHAGAAKAVDPVAALLSEGLRLSIRPYCMPSPLPDCHCHIYEEV